MHKYKIFIASGASGGHLYPAVAVAEALTDQGHTCQFLVGGGKFQHLVTNAGFQLYKLPAAAYNGKNPLTKLKAGIYLIRAFLQALNHLHREQPHVVFGTGGYATVATVLAAKTLGIPIVLHEVNVIPGRANRKLVCLADQMAITFPATASHLNCSVDKTCVTGNPLRKAVTRMAKQPRSQPSSDNPHLHLLILGWSQGARGLSTIIPETLARLPQAVQQRLAVMHQVRQQDMAATTDLYANLSLAQQTITPFVEDVASALHQAHVVITRAGGTMTECALFGRAGIYVPHMLADNHQVINAQYMADHGAGICIPQDLLTTETLYPHLENLLLDTDKRTAIEQAAYQMSQPKAAENVAHLIVQTAAKDVMNHPNQATE